MKPVEPTEVEVLAAAAAIANVRAGRRGGPPLANVLDVLRGFKDGKLYREVVEDARAALRAAMEVAHMEILENAPIDSVQAEAWSDYRAKHELTGMEDQIRFRRRLFNLHLEGTSTLVVMDEKTWTCVERGPWPTVSFVRRFPDSPETAKILAKYPGLSV